MIQAIMAVLFAQHVIACTPPATFFETCWPPSLYIPGTPPRCREPGGKIVDFDEHPMLVCGKPVEVAK